MGSCLLLPPQHKCQDPPHHPSCSRPSDPASPAGWTCTAPPPAGNTGNTVRCFLVSLAALHVALFVDSASVKQLLSWILSEWLPSPLQLSVKLKRSNMTCLWKISLFFVSEHLKYCWGSQSIHSNRDPNAFLKLLTHNLKLHTDLIR